MKKGKPKKKWQVVRTDARASTKMDKKTKEKIVGVGLPFATTFTAGGMGMLTNHTLGCILVGVGLTIPWFFITWMGWVPFLSRRYIQYPGYLVIVVICLILALCVPDNKAVGTQGGSGGNVVSYGQSGGTTAQTVIQNPTINYYFANQSPDEKEKWRQYLTAKYPLGEFRGHLTFLATE